MDRKGCIKLDFRTGSIGLSPLATVSHRCMHLFSCTSSLCNFRYKGRPIVSRKGQRGTLTARFADLFGRQRQGVASSISFQLSDSFHFYLLVLGEIKRYHEVLANNGRLKCPLSACLANKITSRLWGCKGQLNIFEYHIPINSKINFRSRVFSFC